MKTSLLSLLAISTLGLGACIDSTDDTVDTTEPGSSSRIAMNSLGPNQLVMQINSTQLTTASAATEMSTTNGRTTLGYIISCALGTGQSFTSGSYTFQGDMGLAFTWLNQNMTAAQAAAVSACVVARLNADQLAVSISMRGANKSFATSGTETSAYYLNEGVFFGNIFPDQGATTNYACAGEDKLATPNLEDLANRKCTMDMGTGYTKCGLVTAGHCADICTWDSTGTYRSCTFNGTTYANGATVFVQ